MGITKEIERAKSKLIKRYRAKGLCENFGQDEVKRLRDKYGTDYSAGWQQRAQLINDFDRWCYGFTGTKAETEG